MGDIVGGVVAPLFLGFMAAGLIGNAILFFPWIIVVFFLDRRPDRPKWSRLIGPGILLSQLLAGLFCLTNAYRYADMIWLGACLPFFLGVVFIITGKKGVLLG